MKKDVAFFNAWVCISSCIGVLYLTARCTRRKTLYSRSVFFPAMVFFKALSHATWHLLFRLFWRQSAEFFQVLFTVLSLDFSTWEGPKIPIWRIRCLRRLVFGLFSFFEEKTGVFLNLFWMKAGIHSYHYSCDLIVESFFWMKKLESHSTFKLCKMYRESERLWRRQKHETMSN